MVKVFTVPDVLDDDNGPERMISPKNVYMGFFSL